MYESGWLDARIGHLTMNIPYFDGACQIYMLLAIDEVVQGRVREQVDGGPAGLSVKM